MSQFTAVIKMDIFSKWQQISIVGACGMHRRCICVVVLDSNLSDFFAAPSLFADT